MISLCQPPPNAEEPLWEMRVQAMHSSSSAVPSVSHWRHWQEAGAGVADAVSMWTVPVHLRPAGQAFQVICMHAFGDVPLPPITGVIQGLPPRQTLPHEGISHDTACSQARQSNF